MFRPQTSWMGVNYACQICCGKNRLTMAITMPNAAIAAM